MRNPLPVALAPHFRGAFRRVLGETRLSAWDRAAQEAKAIRIGASAPGAAQERCYEIVDGIAIIQVSGVLLDKFPYIGFPWATGYDALRFQLMQAFADFEVKGIAFDIDSGGGMASGCFDLVDWIMATKAAAKKPVAAILSEYAYSAAYAIASTADSIAVPRTGGVGSIGVVMLHLDFSGALEDMGVNPTFIHAGIHKVDGNPSEPLPEDVKKSLQAEVDDLRLLFATTVARNRNLDLKAVMATEAACYEGPANMEEAMKIGLCDAILAPDHAFRQFSDAIAAGG